MDRKNTIKILRDITRKLSDEALFPDVDFFCSHCKGDKVSFSKVDHYIKTRLEL